MHRHNPTGTLQRPWRRLRGPLLGGLLLGGAWLGLAGLAGCSHRREDPAKQGLTAAADAEWTWIQAAKKTLDARRAELAQARAAATLRPGTPAPPAVAALEKEVTSRADELGRRLVDFINADPPIEGEKLSGRRLAAVRLKSDEDILVAHQFIERGGDYRRAIEIYEAALEVDPENPRLQEELASARARRYMTAERFSQVEKGMTLDQVRELLGQPNLRDVREFPERGIVAWFYSRDAAGRAAAVWFARDNGTFSVYLADFHAIEASDEAGTPAAQPTAPPTPAPGS